MTNGDKSVPTANRRWLTIVALLAAFVGLVAFAFAIKAIGDFWNPAVPLRFAILAEVFLCSMALVGMGIGMSFLWFAWRGLKKRNAANSPPNHTYPFSNSRQ